MTTLKRTCRTTHPQLRSGICTWCDCRILNGEIIDPLPTDCDLDDFEKPRINYWDLPRMIRDLDSQDSQVQGITLSNLREQHIDIDLFYLAPDDPDEGPFESHSDYCKFLIKAKSLEPHSIDWPFQLSMIYSNIASTKHISSRHAHEKWAARSAVEIEAALGLASQDEVYGFLLYLMTKNSMIAKLYVKARRYAEELLSRADLEKDRMHANDSRHCGHRILGQIALLADDIETAKAHLIASAEVGELGKSGVLCSFGPNMALAQDLLLRGEKEVVLRYLSRCSTFWVHGAESLKHWADQIEYGVLPDFRGNLHY